MAMPPGNVVMSDKMPFPTNGGGNGGEIHHRQWLLDDRDRFISWLRGEFAASNAIIDCLCHHLRSIGEPGEYDVVMGYIQQRRCNWNPVLHMQQYFSIAEVSYALQQAAWKKQQRYFDKVKTTEKDVKKSPSQGVSTKQWFRVENKENHNSGIERQNREVASTVQSVNVDPKKGQETIVKGDEPILKVEADKFEEKSSSIASEKEGVVGTANSHADVGLKSIGNLEGIKCDNTKAEAVKDDDTSDMKGSSNDLKSGSDSIQKQDEEQNLIPTPKTFVGTEVFDGKAVNVVEGLKLYGELIDSLKLSSIFQMSHELRSAGRRGQLNGQAFMMSKRPMKGRGREVVQLGIPIVDAPQEDEKFSGSFDDSKMEAIPALLQDVIERLVSLQITTVKPDSCIIDFFNEGDHSQPHVCPPWFGRPVCILFLTECDMTFGRVIGVGHPGEYKGSLKLSLLPGSLLSMQGRSADFAKHAISSIRRQRILITFTKSQPKKLMLTDGQHLPPSAAAPHSWGPQPSRVLSQSSQIRHPVVPKHYVASATTGVLPMPPIHQQHLTPPNNIQPVFITSPVAPAMPYPTPVPLPPTSSGWPAVPPPRHPSPRLPLPGTGVFLPPPGSGPPASPQQTVSASAVQVSEPLTTSDNGKGSVQLNCNGNASPKGELDGNTESRDCNGGISTGLGVQQSHDLENVASKPVGMVK